MGVLKSAGKPPDQKKMTCLGAAQRQEPEIGSLYSGTLLRRAWERMERRTRDSWLGQLKQTFKVGFF